MDLFKNSKRKGFAERMGHVVPKTEFQTHDIDDKLITGLWNVFQQHYLIHDADFISRSAFQEFFEYIWVNYFNLPLDTMEDYYDTTYRKIRDFFRKFDWFEVYDFLEAVMEPVAPVRIAEYMEDCNNVLEKHLSAYRFVSNVLVKITDDIEIAEIEKTIEQSEALGLSGVKIHIQSALKMLSDRKNPDYRNSIKESISAVESLARVIDPKAKELGGALKRINKSSQIIHPALENGFKSLYGYTSDEDGIRHAILNEKDIAFEDAKYMLVSCCTFVNYLIVKCQKQGIKLNP